VKKQTTRAEFASYLIANIQKDVRNAEGNLNLAKDLLRNDTAIARIDEARAALRFAADKLFRAETEVWDSRKP
jgi:hypothetical protein